MSRVDPPICIALDKPSLAEALPIIDVLADHVRVFKIGLQLFTAAGPAAVEAVHARGRDVFLDLKVNDIPNTAAGAVRSAASLGVRFLTVHSSGGRAMLRTAVDAARDAGPHLLVVSALTSLDDAALREIGVGRSASDQVDAMAALAADVGAPGLVLGADEVTRVRAAHPGLFLLVPGIRPAGSDAGDQRRTGTPGAVVGAGADLIVLGRAVTAADDPVAATKKILADIGQGVTA